ncbi:HIT family protein [Fulvitalea axinellae]|uniref:HIT family protein n=1 Tax=Fulvitalea axinellae TaxID=1182444 RepID=A0AAU9D333_9BACT|nr:HIT family protein [Fulvitalea axinellae]
MASIFTKIINREIPAHIVAEDENHIAFLDINPLVIGHTLAVPKREVDYIYDLSDEEFVNLQLFAKKVAGAVKKAIPCKRIGEAVIGLEVPHTHIHLIPIKEMDDMNFSRPKLTPSQEELAEAAEKIKAAF